jgi:hypothetical protein
MKKILFSVFVVFPFINLISPQTASVIQEPISDSTSIEKTALDYVEGFYNNDPVRVTAAVHPELIKRIIYKDAAGNAMIQNMGASSLIFAARMNKKNDPDPSVPFKATITIYDIFNDNATIKIVTNKFKFIDYAQLAKVDGNWKIINVLWAMTK